jgi:hypothetical protein
MQLATAEEPKLTRHASLGLHRWGVAAHDVSRRKETVDQNENKICKSTH